jgi:hypothetical protein
MKKFKLISSIFIVGIFMLGLSNQAQAEIIWQENFDSQSDWELTQSTTGDTISSWQGESNIPPNFNFIRIAPSVYDENNQHNSMMINNSNYRGSSGKGLTFWVESGDQTCGSGAHWCSDSLLGINLTGDITTPDGTTRDGYEELWVKLYIKFDTAWDMRETRSTFPMHKMLRTEWWSGGHAPWIYFGDGDYWSPAVVWDLARMNGANGNVMWKTIYRYDTKLRPPWTPPHAEFEDSYFLDGNYGGTGVPFNTPGNVGDGEWHELILHTKLNSDIGIEDGIVESWIDGVVLDSTTDLTFGDVGSQPAPNRRKWNVFILGGNDFNEFDPVFENHAEQYYALDDVCITTTQVDLASCFSTTIIRADVDQSGSVNSTDALLTLRNSLGLEMSSTNWQASSTTGDVNCSSNSNSTDALLILRYSLGLEMTGTGWCVDGDTYTLTVMDPGNNDKITANGINCGDGNTDCSESYSDGTSVTLTAVPDTGRSWVSWGDDASGSSATTGTVTMNSDKTASAVFQEDQSIDCNNLTYEHLNGGTGPAAVGNSESRNAYRGVYWTGENKRICKGEFRVHVTGDVSGINYKVTLWSVDTQNDLELDTLLATSNIISGSSLSDGVWMPFEFSTPQDVISGKTVFLVSRNDVGTKDGSNFIQVYQDYDESDSESRAWNSHYNISGTMEGRHPGDENQPEYFTIPLRLYGENTALAGTAPNMPENINVTAVNSTTLNIDWVEKGVIGVDHYNVYEYNTADASKILVGTVSAPTTEYQHTGLTSGTTHYYVITAVSASGIEGYHSVDRHQSSGDPDWEGTTL